MLQRRAWSSSSPSRRAQRRSFFDEQLTKHLTDVHAIEVQALAQLRRAPQVAPILGLARDLAEHERETREHERLVREEL